MRLGNQIILKSPNLTLLAGSAPVEISHFLWNDWMPHERIGRIESDKPPHCVASSWIHNITHAQQNHVDAWTRPTEGWSCCGRSQTRSQVLRFEEAKYIIRSARFCFYYMFKKQTVQTPFWTQQNLEEHKKCGAFAFECSFVVTGLVAH